MTNDVVYDVIMLFIELQFKYNFWLNQTYNSFLLDT